jgi:hypothetical protein
MTKRKSTKTDSLTLNADSPKQIISISDLVPDTLNANKGSVRGMAMLEESLRRHGAGRSILVDRNGNIIAGNKTAEAYKDIGHKDVVVVDTQGDQLVVVRRLDLDINDPATRELGVDDNRTGEVSLTWDIEVLDQLQGMGVNLARAFDPPELDQIRSLSAAATAAALAASQSLSASAAAPPPPDFSVADESTVVVDFQCPKCGYEWSGAPK